jgi:HTH-type transcriptional regulator, osmoprotectant uptake regulator
MIKSDYFKLQENMARRFGAKPTEATIIAIIKTACQPISLDEISEQTNYSLATVSNTVRKYELLGILFRTKKPGSKKVFVEAKKDFLKSMKESMQHVANNCEFMMQELPKIIEKTKHKEELEQQKQELRQTKIAHKLMSETLKKLEDY